MMAAIIPDTPPPRTMEEARLDAEIARLRADIDRITTQAAEEILAHARHSDALRAERDAAWAEIEKAHEVLCLLPEEADLVTACRYAMEHVVEGERAKTQLAIAQAELDAARAELEMVRTYLRNTADEVDRRGKQLASARETLTKSADFLMDASYKIRSGKPMPIADIENAAVEIRAALSRLSSPGAQQRAGEDGDERPSGY